MKNRGIFIIVFCFICIISFSACSDNETVNQNIEEYKIQSENLKLKITELEEIIQNYKDAEEDEEQTKTNVYSDFRVSDILHLKELNGAYYIVISIYGEESINVQLWKYTDRNFPSMLAEGIDINIETRDPYLYCTVLKNIGKDEYKDEVIKIDKDDKVSVIYEGNDMEISASPNGEYLVFIDNPERNLKILDRNDKIIFEDKIDYELSEDMLKYGFIDSSEFELIPYGWNDKKFWGEFQLGPGVPGYFILNIENFEMEIIENKNMHWENDINMKNGWKCYSDFPMHFDIDSYNEFKESKKAVHLYLYNIYTDEKINIATSVAKEFAPEWIDEYTFEYNDPNSDQRIRYTLETD